MPFAETRAQIPVPMLADYDESVKYFTALPVADRLMLRRLWVLGPLALDNDYYIRMAESNLVCRIATIDSFLMGATPMGGMLCKIYQDKFQGEIEREKGIRKGIIE